MARRSWPRCCAGSSPPDLRANVRHAAGHQPARQHSLPLIFWEAYYKGELSNYPPRNDFVRTYFWSDPAHRSEWLDTAGRVWLDRALHFRDLWNWGRRGAVFHRADAGLSHAGGGFARAE